MYSILLVGSEKVNILTHQPPALDECEQARNFNAV